MRVNSTAFAPGERQSSAARAPPGKRLPRTQVSRVSSGTWDSSVFSRPSGKPATVVGAAMVVVDERLSLEDPPPPPASTATNTTTSAIAPPTPANSGQRERVTADGVGGTARGSGAGGAHPAGGA